MAECTFSPRTIPLPAFLQLEKLATEHLPGVPLGSPRKAGLGRYAS